MKSSDCFWIWEAETYDNPEEARSKRVNKIFRLLQDGTIQVDQDQAELAAKLGISPGANRREGEDLETVGPESPRRTSPTLFRSDSVGSDMERSPRPTNGFRAHSGPAHGLEQLVWRRPISPPPRAEVPTGSPSEGGVHRRQLFRLGMSLVISTRTWTVGFDSLSNLRF